MYQINVPTFNYSDPWDIPFEVRVKSLACGDKKVAYYYETPDNSTFRYRVYNMIQVIRSFPCGISASFFTEKDLNSLDKIADIADVIVICRAKYNDKINRFITKARNKGKTVIFDVDDLIFNPADIHLILDTLDQDLKHPNVWDFWFAYVGRIGMTLSLCDRAITTNNYLASKIEAFTQKPVSVIPNFLNQEQLDISKRIFQEKKANNFKRDGRIHLGYFSGTPSHNKDLGIVSDALIQLLKIDPRLVIRIVGFLDIKGELQNYMDRMEIYPLQDFINLQRLVGEVEINLVPLQDNIFTNCKSELKYFEAGIAGTITVATPTFTYSQSIRDGENGYLAKSYEWCEILEKRIQEIDSFPLIAEKAYRDSEQKFAWNYQIDGILSTLFSEKVSVSPETSLKVLEKNNSSEPNFHIEKQ